MKSLTLNLLQLVYPINQLKLKNLSNHQLAEMPFQDFCHTNKLIAIFCHFGLVCHGHSRKIKVGQKI